MNKPVSSRAGGAASAAAANVCQIVVVSEDRVAHGRAMETARWLTDQFGEEPAFVFDYWNFKDLAEPAVSGKAVAAAAHADIILLSAHGNDLPPAVGHWLERCRETRTKPEGALALLLAEPFMLSASSGKAIDLLQLFAYRLHMDFLPLMPQPAERIIQSFRDRLNLAPRGAAEFFDPPRSDHWGLNE
jgi:hypothetical protein